MNKKIARLLEPNLQLYLVMMLAFALGTFLVGEPIWALAEVGVTALLFLYYRYTNRLRRDKVLQYIETLTGSVERAGANTLMSSPLPTMVFRADTRELIWANDRFLQMAGLGEDAFETELDAVVPAFPSRWVLEGKAECPDTVELNGRHFRVYGALAYAAPKNAKNAKSAEGQSLLATTYWIDTTECDELRSRSEATKPVVALIYHDNYEDVMKSCSESNQSAVQAAIYEKISRWTEGTGCLLTRYAQDRFLLIIEQQHYKKLAEGRFDVLDQVREISVSGGVAPTLSIGVGKDVSGFGALLKNAQLSVEMALSRGGDQAVVKDNLNFEFFGGRTKTSEKRTKVKSRVMANALRELINDAKNVYVMGHHYADMDALGAAAGLVCIARKLGKKAQIVIEPGENAAEALMAKLKELEEYRGVFVSPSEAFLRAEAGSLLVVVDTNRPDFVESPQLLEACNRVAVIDHHRRAASYIENAALNFHEPYASSACELVTELLQYLVEPGDLLRSEAEALLAGMVLDTKKFTQRTGGRTFEAAAYLRRAGADMTEVHRLFQGDLTEMVAKFEIIRHAEMYREKMAVAVAEEETERTTAAQAADELLSLRGVEAAFVVYRREDGVGLSARSAGEVNVQVVLESLGGGGNSTMAGGFVPDGEPQVVAEQLRESIDRYLET
ncbi:MAG: DHH family phosphoesterase [Oscillospiraceae bacterium]